MRDLALPTRPHRRMAAEQGPGPPEEEEQQEEALGLDLGLVDAWVSREDCVRGG